MTKKMEIILERSGKFNASLMNDTPFKCGAMRNKTYHYAVRIEALDTRLSPEGFLLNNELVQIYFDSTFGPRANSRWDAISCENMARRAAKELCESIVSQGIVLICVTVSIKGSNGAWLSAKCKPQDGQVLGWHPIDPEFGPEGYN